jgi:diapolycopene oxygenase
MVGKSVVVIGAGLGGISAAVSLASEGFSVLVFEKNDKIGGKLNVREKQGFLFDLGPSILTLPHIFRRLFSRAAKRMEDYVALEEIRPHWRNFFEDATRFDLTPDTRLMERELEKIGAKETDRFFAFLGYARRQYAVIDRGYFAKGYDTLFELVKGYGARESLLKIDALRSMDQGVRQYVKNEKLRDVLDYFSKYVGSSPFRAPALLNLLPYAQFGFGLWYVKGGMYGLARALERLMNELQVNVQCGAEVSRITVKGNKVTGVVLKDGTSYAADIVVCNMEVVPAYERLLKEDASFLARFRKFEPSCSGLVVHLGVGKRFPQLAHHNFFFSGNARENFRAIYEEEMLPPDPTIYVVCPSRTDPTQAPYGCENIKLLPHIPHLNSRHRYTPADYLAYKDKLIDKLERMGLEGLRENTLVEDIWTPEDLERAYYSNKGAIYGVVSDRFKNLGFKAPKRSAKYDNLYFAGGSVNPGGGMPMVTLSGQLVRDMILQDRR